MKRLSATTSDNKPAPPAGPKCYSMIMFSTLWDECSTCGRDGSPVWTCESAAEAYDDMMGGSTSIAEIVELEGSEGKP